MESTIPTLLLSGAFDPITPPPYAELVAQDLRNSYAFTFPDVGHGALIDSQCAMAITSSFLADPQTSPDSGCLAQQQPPVFLTPDQLQPTSIPGEFLEGIEHNNTTTVILLALLVLIPMFFLLIVVIWPIFWIVRLIRNQPADTRLFARVSPVVVLVVGILAVAMLAGLTAAVFDVAQQGRDALLYMGVPANFAWALWLGPITLVFALDIVALAVVAWVQQLWGLGRRIYMSLLGLLAVAYSAALIISGLGWAVFIN